jgi:hypothetical protein
MMVVVAIVGGIAWGYSLCQEWTLGHGLFSSVLASGKVVATRDVVVVQDRSISGGTACLVLKDYARDEDDCDSSRSIEVRILEGPHKDEIAYIVRFNLRHKR